MGILILYFMRLILRSLLKIIPDKYYLSVLYFRHFKRILHWRSPKAFSEKLQFLKIYDRRSEYTQMVDKYAVKEYVAQKIGEEYVIPTLNVWDKIEDIDWDNLPNQFVLKTTHGGGSNGVIICRDKSVFDRKFACESLQKAMFADIYIKYREWPYKNVRKRIIAEEYIMNENSQGISDLLDYKFFCFNGKPKYCQVISGRSANMCIDFFDKAWQHQDFHEPHNYPFAEKLPQKPSNFNKMWELATVLANGKPFVRIDFYNINGKIYFGEITFFPTSGFGGFDPIEWDYKFGSMIDLCLYQK